MQNQRRENNFRDERLELLLFSTGGSQVFGINVLKVKEVIGCPVLTHLPGSHPAVRGVAHLRGEPLTVIDLGQAIGRTPVCSDDGRRCEGSIIITEFNRNMQGFLVSRVERIVICEWHKVLPPPHGTGSHSYITGVTRLDDRLVQLLDVEKVLAEVVVIEGGEGSDDWTSDVAFNVLEGHSILVVDDSSLARSQTVSTLKKFDLRCATARDGVEALKILEESIDPDSGKSIVDMVISDIEMPEMDGYTLTREIRANPKLAKLFILLHTSLNGAINIEKARQAGANDVLTKFVPKELAQAVLRGMVSW
jgi:two-component system, chemotaxis family, chemotaxis protein CheV